MECALLHMRAHACTCTHIYAHAHTEPLSPSSLILSTYLKVCVFIYIHTMEEVIRYICVTSYINFCLILVQFNSDWHCEIESQLFRNTRSTCLCVCLSIQRLPVTHYIYLSIYLSTICPCFLTPCHCLLITVTGILISWTKVSQLWHCWHWRSGVLRGKGKGL